MKFAIVGSNFVADWMIEAGKRCTNFELHAIYSRTVERAREYAALHGAPVYYTAFEALEQDPDIEAVYLASPTCCHAEQAVRLMKAGKHILCEKPMAFNLQEFTHMTETARKNHVILLEAMRSDYSPAFQAVKNGLSKLGTLRRASLRFCQYSSRYDKFKQGIVENAFRPDIAGGAIMDIGVYPIHAMIALFGAPHSISSQLVPLHTGVDGEGSILFHYGEMLGEVSYSKITNSFLPCEIQGENGNLLFDRITNMSKVEIQYRDGSREILYEKTPEDEMRFELEAFLQYTLSGQFPEKELEITRLTLCCMDEIRKTSGILFPADH